MSTTTLSPLLQTALDSIDQAIDGMSDEQLAWHPPEKWSSAEILEHLSLAYSRTADRMKSLLQKGQPEVRKRTFRERVGGLIVLKLERIPPGRKAPEALCPKGISPSEIKVSIRKNLVEMDRMITECEQRFGNRGDIMVHAVLGPLSVPEWRKFHCVHTRHHMRQVGALRERMSH